MIYKENTVASVYLDKQEQKYFVTIPFLLTIEKSANQLAWFIFYRLQL